MKKTALFLALCLTLVLSLSLPAGAETVLTGEGITVTVSSVEPGSPDVAVRIRTEGFDGFVFRSVPFAAEEGAPEAEEYEISGNEWSFVTSRSEVWRTFVLEAGAGEEKRTVSYSMWPDFCLYEPTETEAPAIVLSVVADRIMATATDGFGLDCTWDSLTAEPAGRSGRKTATWVSESMTENGTHCYTAYAKDPSGNVTAKTVFLETTGLAEVPASGDASPNTADPLWMIASAAVLCAAGFSVLRRRRT